MVKSPRRGRIRLVLDLPEDIYFGVQKGAITGYTTMTNYVMRAILERFEKEGLIVDDSDRIIIPRQPRNKNKKFLTNPDNT